MMKTVGLLMGGTSREREVSVQSGTFVGKALEELGYAVRILDPQEPRWQEKLIGVDMVYNTLHGPVGEDGTVQGYLQMCGIPYTGTGVLGSAVSMDKIAAKRIALACGIPTPAYLVVTADMAHGAVDMLAKSSFSFPLVVKVPREGSSIGVFIVHDAGEFQRALQECLQLDSQVMVEEYIQGYELTSGFLDDLALPLVGIVAGNAFYDYAAKYTKGMTVYDVPGKVDPSAASRVVDYSRRLCRALGLRGAFRVDYMLKDDVPYFLEVNTNPGMTQTSLIPKAAGAAGMSFADVVAKVLEGVAKS
ncbi:D-alanine/D-alanine ligase [Desulfurispirillum indicum S5]|uniref:D-alanine--D-alanine ligase n=1 Tax=Desulfurispirillum indicum (strain ATCC BAA-1389 / DSM 22839 / S5) TaxID=653733 RepID=E6W422_DESIS|nr:D-alanine--D-alanine ligase [Desulfurispirillum indicum]ADU66986.1 D-alanine/D-alanine ligase [Desulfurispirillum indicum S5]